MLKTTTFREGSQETNIEGGLLKKGGLGQFPDLTGGLARMRGWCFWGGLILNAHDDNLESVSYKFESLKSTPP